MTTSNWDKFVLLLWKNWIIQKRHYVQTGFEITIPVLACSLLMLVRGLVTPTVYSDPTTFSSLNVESLSMIREMITNHPISLRIVYSPRNDVLEQVIGRAARILGTDVLHHGYNDSDSMYNELVTHNYLAGVDFGEEFKNITALPERLKIALRFPSEMRTTTLPGAQFWANWRTFLIFPQFQVYGARNINFSDGGYPANYYAEGFASVQNAISRAVLEMRMGRKDLLPHVELKRFPYPAFYDDPLLRGLENLFPSIIMVAFFYSCINTVKFITLEKENQLKESMKVMGLSGWIHWVAWFVRTLTLLTVSITLITLMLSCNLTTNTNVAIFQFSDRLLIWLFFFVYGITTIMLCFMISTFFSKANIASGIAGIVWFYSLTPFQLTFGSYDRMSLGAKLGSSLWSNTAMGYGVMLFMKHEGTSIGLQWSNLFYPVTVDDQLTMAHVFGMLLLDAALYLAVALYVEQVAPGTFGVPRRWNFPLTRSFWVGEVCGGKRREENGTAESKRLRQSHRYSANMEDDEPAADKHVGIETVGLTKVFDQQRRPAVRDLTVSFYRDEITVLLGHNGAGKTTTMAMLTGMYPATGGYAAIEGNRIGSAQSDRLRNTLGFCPQHNVLFNELTVAEHVRFFAKLKGIRRGDEIEAEIVKYLRALELEPKRNAQAYTLSGGMKRKLSLAVALVGDSKVVFCDEPTSGMDPAARRTVWELLQQEKRGRTIVLSTHFMDEADVLGDRIAIMCDGELRAAGTPFFLKKRFGAGYRLICVKGPNCQPDEVTALLRRYVPDAAVESDIGTELSFRLREEHRPMFQPALEELERNVGRCGVSSYGIALSTLEEVFMRLGSYESHTLEDDDPEGHGQKVQHLANGTREHDAPPPITITETYELETGRQLLASQIRAMLSKKYLSFIRSWKISSLQVLLPMFFVLLVIAIVRFFPNNVVLPPLEITLGSYGRTVTILSTNDRNASIVTAYGETIREAGSVGGSNELIVTNASFTDFILQKSRENIRSVDNTFMFGATMDVPGRNLTAWFNNKAYHTAPLSLSVLYNALGRAHCANCSLTVTNRPLPYSSHVRFLRTQSGSNLGFQLAFNTGFAMAFVGALYILFYVRERASGSKLLQFVSGVDAVTFWGVSFAWDFLVYCFAMALYLGTLAAFREDGWSTPAELIRVALVFVCFGLAVIPFTYLGAHYFDVPSTGFIKMLIFNIFTGTVMFTAVFLLKVKDFDLRPVAETLEWVYMIFPLFALSHSLNNINLMETTRQICDAYCDAMPFCTPELACKFNDLCCDVEIFSFNPRGINRNLVYMLGVAALSFTVLLLREYRLLPSLRLDRCRKSVTAKLRSPSSSHNHADETEPIAIGEDLDVADERIRIEQFYDERTHQSAAGPALLMLRDLTKRYGNVSAASVAAVDRLTFAVGERECFGLLGVNGAGKTSTFRMLTGDRRITSGDAWVAGHNLRTQLPAVYRRIGYCPQFDALLDDLTGRETVRMFARLRGIPEHAIASTVERLAVELNFTAHLDKRVHAYSGGNRRKLSTALALLGDPAVVYLDEPTTGMDPGAKRHFWNVMCRVRAEGRTALVLTSHSMEECEALCTRLAIMVNGEFRCLGSAQHLKNKFSHGYFLTMKLKRADTKQLAERNKLAVKRFVQETFTDPSSTGGGGAILKEEYQNYLTYHLVDTERRWSELFGTLERARERLELEDYALGQTSLEQVFLTLTATQRDSDN